MKKFKLQVEVIDAPDVMSCEIFANDESDAIQKIKEVYAMELGTVEEEIKVTIEG